VPLELLMDTGPLVAYFAARDEHHRWAVETFNQITSHVATCEPVLAEAFHLISPSPQGKNRLIEFCSPENLRVDFRLLDHMEAIYELLHKYRDQPMDLADACLVLLAELNPQATIITTDRDFLVYRTRNRRQLRLLAPFAT